MDALDTALAPRNQAHLPPTVICELLSVPCAAEIESLILALPRLGILDGYWERAGHLRRRLHAEGRKAALADTLIAQSCLDHDVALLTRDRDFSAFARLGGLTLAGRS